MARLTTTLIAATALIAVAGCAKKRPEELPPAPLGTEQPGQPGLQDPGSNPSGTVLPGSREDFMRSVTTDTVYFATDGYDIDGEARAGLDSQAAWLARYPNVRITIEGHCDERGTRDYNLALGDRRANAAKNYLAALGVSASRISTISYGKERPAQDGSDDSAWARNRRAVTVTLQ